MREASEEIFYIREDSKGYICDKYGNILFSKETYNPLYCGENAWMVVDMDESEAGYALNYIDLEGNVMLELSDKYISAEGFRKITEDDMEENTEDNTQKQEDEVVQDVSVHVFQGEIESITYRNRDDVFSVTLTNGDVFFTDRDGKLLDDVILKSDYLEVDGTKKNKKAIYDMYGKDVTGRFIQDYEHEKIIGLCRMETQDVIWIKETRETPTDSLIIVKAFDEWGKELCRVESDDIYFSDQLRVIENFSRITYVQYVGDNVCRVYYTHSCDEPYFSVNVENGTILNANGTFSDGYAVIDGVNIHGIQGKNEGRYIIGPVKYGDSLYDIILGALEYSDGLFYSSHTKKFYDIKMNEKIDLSQYDKVSIGLGQCIFIDGYCGVEVENKNGTEFYGLMDTEGNWVLELTDTLDPYHNAYSGKLSETKVRLGYSKIYDIKTKQYESYPNLPYDGILLDGKYYFVEDNEFGYYDFQISKYYIF